MTERNASNQGLSEPRLDVAALLRAGADDELSSHDERRLEAHLETHPEDGARLLSERELRQAVSRAMSGAPGLSAPNALRDRVASAMREVDLDDPGTSIPFAETRELSFWASRRTRGLMAIAAILALAVTVTVVFNQSGTGVPFTAQPQGLSQVVADRTSAATFVAAEHSRCCLESVDVSHKFTVGDRSNLPDLASDVIGQSVSVEDLLAGGATQIEFMDAGRCGVPGGGKSLHLRFNTPENGDTVSLFIQESSGRMQFEEGVTYEIPPTEEAPNSPSIFIWMKDGLNYYLVIEKPEACEQLRDIMSAPSTIRPLTDIA